ncbi:MAG TPA: pyruvate dehydrogenase (acetyl-transferring) E1 component subunit alpha, partial [Polyangiales bacterium]|nr:pyruvate dehydrogenase (acetyl-transferring) E1 component subunit alpha [Polyangiales bacterium]
ECVMELPFDRDQALHLFEQMLLIRRFEEKSAELYTQQKIHGFLHLYVGEEAIAVGAMHALAPDDAIVSTYREHGHAIARGVPPSAVMAEMFGKVNGCARGRGGSMHLFDASRRFYGGYAIVGGGLPIAAGLALCDLLQGKSRVTVCLFGDGATDEGEFHETLNLASLWRLPVLFLCENNQYAMGTALARHSAGGAIKREPAAHGIDVEAIDGMDVAAVYRACRYACESIRAGGGPRYLDLETYRFRAHSMYDAERYRSKDEVAQWKKRDPIDRFAAQLREARWLGEAEARDIEQRVQAEIERAVQSAEQGDWEPEADLCRFLYAEHRP